MGAQPPTTGVEQQTGGLLRTAVNIINAMVGVGLLALPQAIAILGWVGGILSLLVFFLATLLVSYLLVNVFEVNGKKNPRYFDAVGEILGPRAEKVAAGLQLCNIFLACVAYIISAALSMKAVANLSCGLPPATSSAGGDHCVNSTWIMCAIFGGLLVFVVQLPGTGKAWIISSIGTVCCFSYIGIIVGLSINKIAEGGAPTSVGGIESSPADKAFNILNSIGNIAFGFSFSTVILEVADTIREPPKAMVTMVKACNVAITLGFCFYTLVGVLGYAGLGNVGVTGNVLQSFDSPRWLLILANMLLVVQMVASYNINAQVLFLTIEGSVARWVGLAHPAEAEHAATHAQSASEKGLSHSTATTPSIKDGSPDSPLGEYAGSGGAGGVTAHLTRAGRRAKCWAGPFHMHAVAGPLRTDARKCRYPAEAAPGRRPTRLEHHHLFLLSVAVRATFVAITTVCGIVLPFFEQVTGVIGGLSFWPVSVYFPIAMWLEVYRPSRRIRLGLHIFSAVMFLASAGATIGAFRNIIESWKTYHLSF